MRKKEICPKCGCLRYPHQHHILPKVLFGKVGFIKRLCSDCHEEYHEDLRKASGMKYHPPVFYVTHFIKWMSVPAIIYLISLFVF